MASELLRKTVIENPYIPKMDGKFPSAPQAFFLTAPIDEILYGGAAGGGKSAGILAAGLQYVDYPGYDALIVRRSYADLEKPGGLIPLSHVWLANKDCTYDGQTHRWTFPSGATLGFGHIQNDQSVVQDFQGSAFSYIGFDELTQFSLYQYRYLGFSRKRKLLGLPFPTRVRATSNPGGSGHEWVKARFITAIDSLKRLFIPAMLEDNPGLDRADYEQSLLELDPVTRRQLRHGDWDVRPEGNLFKREWFTGRMLSTAPIYNQRVRYWDLAATEPKQGTDPDFASGALLGSEDGKFIIENVKRFRESPRQVMQNVILTAKQDGVGVSIRIEQEPGSASKILIDDIARKLSAFDVRGIPSVRSKQTRAKPFSAACERGDVSIVEGPWNEVFLDELCAFGGIPSHDDQVDAVTGAFNELAQGDEWGEADLSSLKNLLSYSNR